MSEYTSPNETISLNFNEYLDAKVAYDYRGTNNLSSSDLYNKQQNQRENDQFNSLLKVSAGVGLSSVLYNEVKNNNNLLQKINSLKSANLLTDRLVDKFNSNGVPTNIDPTFSNKAAKPLSNSLASILTDLEEMSPLHILKTLQLSSFSTLFVEVIDQQNKIHIKPSSISVYKDYYRNLILNNSGYQLDDLDFKNGFNLENNKLYQRLANGENGRELLGHARIINTNTEIGGENGMDSPNRVFQKFSNMHGVQTHVSQFKQEPLAVVGASDKNKAISDWVRAYGRFSTEIGYKVLDNPLGSAEEYINTAFGEQGQNLTKSKFYTTLKKYTNVQLGTGGDYTLGNRESLIRSAKNLAVKSTALYVGYQGINALLDDFTPESSVWHKGILAGLSANYQEMRVNFAETWSDNFQGYREKQEEASPESTKISTLIGLPLAGFMLGANSAYFERIYDSARKGTIASSMAHSSEKVAGGIVGDALTRRGSNIEGSTLRRRGSIGALAGAALALPYLPGALIGESSEELRDKYSGKVEEGIRQNRGWLFGGEPFEGGKIQYYRKNLTTEWIKDAKGKALYENSDEQRALDPIFSPFNYLQNPYAFEERHTDSMPYPVWGMDVTYGSFMGELFEGSIGQVIKPDVVNPEMTQLMSPKRTAVKFMANMVSEYSENQEAKISGETNPGAYTFPVVETRQDKLLVQEGLMMSKPSADFNRAGITATNTYTAMSDFAGLKGFSSSLILDSMYMNPETQLQPQLARSGSGVTAKDTLQSMEQGDLLGFGEFTRRLIPQSSATDSSVVNPLKNTVSPTWLPSNENRYYKDFSRGNYYDNAVRGETMLPGKGYAELTPELKGINSNDYPLVYQYKILQNVAKGSPEHQSLRDYLATNLETLSPSEQNVFFEAYGQEKSREQEKRFFEYKTDADRSRMGFLQLMQSTLWDSISHLESPLEPLTPFRPMAKFVHQRTAIEDYQKTQLAGPDTGIWTKPGEHFILPAKNRVIQLLNDNYKPKEVQEKENVDEYFDKLAFLKAVKKGSLADAQRTVIGSSYLGIKDQDSMKKFKASLPDNQRAYVEAFAKEKDSKKREAIQAMLPKDIARNYMNIWQYVDTYDEAKSKGLDPKDEVANQYVKETNKIAEETGIRLSRDELATINSKAVNIENAKEKQKFLEAQKGEAVRLKAAEQEALTYIQNQTGSIPDDDWIGWDPRLTIDDIKLKTLTVGREDIHRYGYWEKEQERNNRIVAFQDNDPIISNIENIKRDMKTNRQNQFNITQKMRRAGFEVTRMSDTPSAQRALTIEDGTQYMEEYTN